MCIRDRDSWTGEILDRRIRRTDETDFLTEEATPSLWISETKDLHQFRQFYSTSDKMSSVFSLSAGCAVADALNLQEVPFTSCLLSCCQSRSKLIWISPPVDPIYEGYYAELSCKLAEQQLATNTYFVIAMPWSSSFWSNPWMLYLKDCLLYTSPSPRD